MKRIMNQGKESTKSEIMTALLQELEKTPLKKITIQQIAAKAGISKQTFYNHFRDKEELICAVYEHIIIPEFDLDAFPESFGQSYLRTLNAMKEYGRFMRQALLLEGQNDLKSYITSHCEQFDLAYHTHLYEDELPPDLRLATIYHANASSAMTFSWILGGFVSSPQDMVKLVCAMRALGMDEKIAKAYKLDD